MGKFRIKQWVLLVLVFAIISSTFGISYVYYIRNQLTDEANEFLKAVSIQESEVIRDTFHDGLEELKYLTGKYQLVNSDISTEDKLNNLREEVDRKSFLRIGIADRNGNAKTTDNKEFSIEDRKYFQKALKGTSSVSEKLTDKVDNRSDIVVLATPIYNEDEIVGVLFATELAENLPKMVKPIFYKEQANIYIIDSEGIIITTSNRVSIKANQNLLQLVDINEDERLAILNGEAGNSKYIHDGVRRYIGFSKIEGTSDWRVLVTIPKATVMHRANDTIIVTSIFTFGSILVLLLAFIYILKMEIRYKDSKENEAVLLKKSQIDKLSELYNRVTFEEMVQTQDGEFTLFFIDIDDFKYFNTMYGHAVGDKVISFIGDSIQKTVKDIGFAGRVGGDEFVVCITHTHLNVEGIAQSIIGNLEKGFEDEDKVLSVGCSIGIVKNGQDGLTYTELVKKADEAMYVAKHTGKGKYVVVQ